MPCVPLAGFLMLRPRLDPWYCSGEAPRPWAWLCPLLGLGRKRAGNGPAVPACRDEASGHRNTRVFASAGRSQQLPAHPFGSHFSKMPGDAEGGVQGLWAMGPTRDLGRVRSPPRACVPLWAPEASAGDHLALPERQGLKNPLGWRDHHFARH